MLVYKIHVKVSLFTQNLHSLVESYLFVWVEYIFDNLLFSSTVLELSAQIFQLSWVFFYSGFFQLILIGIFLGCLMREIIRTQLPSRPPRFNGSSIGSATRGKSILFSNTCTDNQYVYVK